MPVRWNRSAFRLGGSGTQPLRIPWWIMFLPVFFLTLAIMSTGFMWYVPHFRVPIPMKCVPTSNLTRLCHPEKVAISVLSTKPFYTTRATAMNVTWIPHARYLGMQVNFFGEVSDDLLPVISLTPDGEPAKDYTATTNRGSFKRIFAMWEWTYQHYPEHWWYFKCDDNTFMHPYEFVAKSVCRHDYSAAKVIGKFSESSIEDEAHLWMKADAGYLLSRPALKKLLDLYHDGKCKDRHDEDVSVLSCLHHNGVRASAHSDYNPNIPTRNVFWEARNWTLYTTYNPIDEDDAPELAEASFAHCSGYARIDEHGQIVPNSSPG